MVFYPGWWMLLLYEYWFGRQSGLGYHASNAPQVNWQAVSQWRIYSIYRVFFSMRSVTCFWNHFPLWKFLNNMSLSTSNTKVEHDSIDSCISNGFAAMSKAITFHCQAVSLEDGTTQWPPHVCTCKTDAATESSMQNDPWSNHPATAPWIFFPILHPHPLWSTLIHSDPLWSTPIHSVLGETDNLWCDGPMPHQTPRASGVRRAVGMRGFKDSRKMFVAPPKDSNNYDGELNCFFLFWGFD